MKTLRIWISIALCLLVAPFKIYSKPKNNSQLNILVSIKPFYNITAAITDDLNQPTLLLKGQASPHNYQLRPSEYQELMQADLVIWGGATVEPFLVKPLTGRKKPTLNLSEIEGLILLTTRHNCSHHDHQHHGIDPHFWLHPENAILIAHAIATQLITINSAEQIKYFYNLTNLIKQIMQAKNHVLQQLSQYTPKNFMVFHDAYQYFELAFNLNYSGAISLNPEIPLSAQRIQQLQQDIRNKNITCIFSEPQFPNHITQQLTEQFPHIKQATLDPLGKDSDLGPQGYPNLLINLSNSILQAFTKE